jgi:F0F1-type ATP synthase membrane subunit a
MYLELLIAFLQSYVFVILITLYINDVINFHD